MERKMVTERKDIRWELDGLSLKAAALKLQSLDEDYPNSDLDIDTIGEYGYQHPVIYIRWKRLESDKEVKARLDSEAKHLEWKKKQYEQLKKEFE
jgi:hypothetical protein